MEESELDLRFGGSPAVGVDSEKCTVRLCGSDGICSGGICNGGICNVGIFCTVGRVGMFIFRREGMCGMEETLCKGIIGTGGTRGVGGGLVERGVGEGSVIRGPLGVAIGSYLEELRGVAIGRFHWLSL